MQVRTLATRSLATILLSVVFVSSALTTRAHAQVNCGDIIVAAATMLSNLTACPGNPAVTVDGGTLDMNGFAIIGCVAGDGIHVIGNNARVDNGRVEGCIDGISLAGGGGHRIENVRSEINAASGFRFVSSNNRIEYTSSAGNAIGWRLMVGANNNDVRYSTAFGNTIGAVVGGNRSDFRESTAADNAGGMQIMGNRTQLRDFTLARTPVTSPGDRGKYKYVFSVGNGVASSIGFEFIGNRNRLERSRVAGHGTAVKIGGNDNRVRLSTIVDSLVTGVSIGGMNNRVDRNMVAGDGSGTSGAVGIEAIVGSMMNRIDRNAVLNHTVNDLQDADPICANNLWQNNIEKLKTPTCLN